MPQGTNVTSTSMTHTLVAERHARTTGIALRRALMGFVYTIPTIIFIVVLFLTPLVLVGASADTQQRAQRWNDVMKRLARLGDICCTLNALFLLLLLLLN